MRFETNIIHVEEIMEQYQKRNETSFKKYKEVKREYEGGKVDDIILLKLLFNSLAINVKCLGEEDEIKKGYITFRAYHCVESEKYNFDFYVNKLLFEGGTPVEVLKKQANIIGEEPFEIINAVEGTMAGFGPYHFEKELLIDRDNYSCSNMLSNLLSNVFYIDKNAKPW